jgi:hydrogenase maturation protease
MPTEARGNNPQDLKNWLNGAKKTVIAGIGNPIREDDFVGVKIVQNLQDRVSKKVFLIECETVPENFVQQIIDFGPTHILLIDAAIHGLIPGEWKLVDPEDFLASRQGLSAKAFASSFNLFCLQFHHEKCSIFFTVNGIGKESHGILSFR